MWQFHHATFINSVMCVFRTRYGFSLLNRNWKTVPKDAKSQWMPAPVKQSARHQTGDGILRVQREKKGRGGKTVTTITGFEG